MGHVIGKNRLMLRRKLREKVMTELSLLTKSTGTGEGNKRHFPRRWSDYIFLFLCSVNELSLVTPAYKSGVLFIGLFWPPSKRRAHGKNSKNYPWGKVPISKQSICWGHKKSWDLPSKQQKLAEDTIDGQHPAPLSIPQMYPNVGFIPVSRPFGVSRSGAGFFP